MTELSFAVLPFVRTDAEVDLGGLQLWESTAPGWRTRFGCDPPQLLGLYHGRDGRPTRSLSILSKATGAPTTLAEYQDAVVILSTADWLRGHSGTASDHWVFEPWRIDSGDEDHVRLSKFSMNLTNAEHDRFYPDPYTRSTRFNVLTTQDAVHGLGALAADASAASRGKLTALWHLYLARRDSPHFGSLFEDLEAIWSAFEAWYQIPPRVDYANGSRLARLARTWLPRPVGQRIIPGLFNRPSRSGVVFARMREALKDVLQPRLERPLADLLTELYDLRNEQTHGGAPQRHRLRREAEDAHALGLALEVWRTCLEIELFGRNPFTQHEVALRLRDTFLEKSIRDSLLAAFAGTKRTDWYNAAGAPDKPELLREAAPVIKEALTIRTPARRYKAQAAARNARRTALLVLSAWTTLAASRADCVEKQEPTAGLLEQMSAAAKLKQPDAVDGAMVKELVQRKAFDPEEYSEELGDALGDIGGLDYADWCHLVIRLHELVSGYELL